MADSDLPVFSFRPNWAGGVTERLSFLTTVQRSRTGAEQRRQLRPTPRRAIEADFLLVGPERTYFDLFMNKFGGGEVMAPLHWDVAKLSAPTVAGFTQRILFDTSYREFEVGGLAILQRKDAQVFEVVEVAAIDSAGVDLAAPVQNAWPRGTTLMPLRRFMVDDMGSPSHETAAVATVSVRLISNSPNHWTPAADPAPVYAGLPVQNEEPNWIDGLPVGYDRDTTRLDNQISRLFQVDPMGRFLAGQGHRWFLNGRQRLAFFRDLVYRRGGRRGGFWLPTFKADLTLASSATAASTQITVQRAGLDYADVPQPGREYLAIRHASGTIFRRILSVLPGLTPTTERVNLDAALGLALSPGQVRKISFMDTSRFDQDEFEITHHGALDGLHECETTFRAFNNSRTAPLPIHAPIPTTAKSETPCGVGEDDCYYVPPLPWALRIKVDFADGKATEYTNVYQAITGQAWVGVNGRVLGDGFNCRPGNLTDDTNYPAPDGGAPLRIIRDYNNPDGTPGGPIIGFRYPSIAGFEWFFFGVLSMADGDREFNWNHQFGANGANGSGNMLTVTVSNAQGTVLYSGQRPYGSLWPYGYALEW